MSAPAPGLIIAAPASGSGKTVLTLALARALGRRGRRIATAKAGPDYIDPGFHEAATGRASVNLDPWAMRTETLDHLVAGLGADADLVLCEGAMGLFDGIDAGGTASSADLAARLGWPVVLVVDVRGQSASVAALVAGFARHRRDVLLAGVICNRVGGPAHAAVLAEALMASVPEVALLGAVPRDSAFALPERHLGLVPAIERPELPALIERAADAVERAVDLDALVRLARPARIAPTGSNREISLPPLGCRIAVARDDAFQFAYPSVLASWRASGAEIVFFSPLADQAPHAECDAVFLPGGYPELQPGRLAAAAMFKAGLRRAAARGAAVYGECGGYMVLGRGLIGADGTRFEMAGLLALESSFAQSRLHLGYRRARLLGSGALGPGGVEFRGHEFHYASVLDEGPGAPLFEIADAGGRALGTTGRRAGLVAGSFVHLVDRA